MIPKIIHFCWLSNDPFPKEIEKCMASWKKVLPDYEFWKWDFDRFPKDKSAWVSEAFDKKKYAFAADYIRNYALYNFGGIYLDTDVEMLKSFDALLHLPYFMGFENGSGCIEAAVLASEPHSPIFKQVLDQYEGRHFVNADGSFNTKPLPKLMMEVLSANYKFQAIKSPESFVFDADTISILPFDYFSPIHIEHKQLESTSNTISIHRFAGTWTTGWPKYRRYIKACLGPNLTKLGIKIKRLIFGRK